MTETRLVGTVRTIREGFGFLTVPGHPDHFFHKSGFLGGRTEFYRVADGSVLEFLSIADYPTPRAEAIVILTSGEPAAHAYAGPENIPKP